MGLGAAIDWLEKVPKKDWQNLHDNTRELYDFLASSDKVHLYGSPDKTTMSF